MKRSWLLLNGRGNRRSLSRFVHKRKTNRCLSSSATGPKVSPTVTVTQHYATAGRTSSSMTLDLDRAATTQLVDQLLQSTRRLMDQGRLSSPQQDEQPPSVQPNHQHYHHQHNHLIAFSGGVDSSLAAALVHRCHYQDTESVRAVLGTSPAVPTEQVHLAERMASEMGISFTMVPTTEGSDAVYLANEGKACLACKTHLYQTLQAIVQAQAAQPHNHHHTNNNFTLYNGTNADDLTDPTRLGLVAAREFNVLSPLQALSKAAVRTVARHFGLSNWNYAASPCLRSRLALGVTATAEHLRLMAAAERLVRQHHAALSSVVDETTNLRVRLLAGHCVCTEIDAPLVDVVQAQDWSALQTLGGFAEVRVRAFQSGSVARREDASVSVDQTEEEEDERPAAVGLG